MLNQSSLHAIRAMAHLAAAEDQWVRAKDLAESAEVPFHYLAKLLGQLVRAGMLEATRGKHGGYRLRKRPAEITLFDVVDTIEPLAGPRQCLLVRRECDPENGCLIHDKWGAVIFPVYEFLKDTTVADIQLDEEMLASLPLTGV